MDRGYSSPPKTWFASHSRYYSASCTAGEKHTVCVTCPIHLHVRRKKCPRTKVFPHRVSFVDCVVLLIYVLVLFHFAHHECTPCSAGQDLHFGSRALSALARELACRRRISVCSRASYIHPAAPLVSFKPPCDPVPVRPAVHLLAAFIWRAATLFLCLGAFLGNIHPTPCPFESRKKKTRKAAPIWILTTNDEANSFGR